MVNPLIQRGFFIGLATGVGLAALGGVALAALAPGTRPAIKALMKAGISAYRKGTEMAAEVGESTEDLMAEIYSELEEEAQAEEAAAAAAAAAAATAEETKPKPKPRRRTKSDTAKK